MANWQKNYKFINIINKPPCTRSKLEKNTSTAAQVNNSVFCTRVRRLVRDASEGRFGRAVPGYVDWYVMPPRGVLAGLYQGTLICTPNPDWYTKNADWHTFETPRRAEGETPRARRRAARRRSEQRDANRRDTKQRDTTSGETEGGETEGRERRKSPKKTLPSLRIEVATLKILR